MTSVPSPAADPVRPLSAGRRAFIIVLVLIVCLGVGFITRALGATIRSPFPASGGSASLLVPLVSLTWSLPLL